MTINNLPTPLLSDLELFECVFGMFGSGNLTTLTGNTYRCDVPQIPLFQNEGEELTTGLGMTVYMQTRKDNVYFELSLILLLLLIWHLCRHMCSSDSHTYVYLPLRLLVPCMELIYEPVSTSYDILPCMSIPTVTR